MCCLTPPRKNVLDLCPLLWQHVHENQDVSKLLEYIAENASSKECIIALHETQETLLGAISKWHDDEEETERGFELVDRMCLLLDLYATGMCTIGMMRLCFDTRSPSARGFAPQGAIGDDQTDCQGHFGRSPSYQLCS